MILETLALPLAVSVVVLGVCLGITIKWNRLLQKSLNAAKKRGDEQSERLGANRAASEKKYALLMDKNLELKDRIDAERKANEPRSYDARRRFSDVQSRMLIDPGAARDADVREMLEAMRAQILNDVVHDAVVEISYDEAFMRHTVDLSCKVSMTPPAGSVQGFDPKALHDGLTDRNKA